MKVSGYSLPRNRFALYPPIYSPFQVTYSDRLYFDLLRENNFGGNDSIVSCSVKFSPFVDYVSKGYLVDQTGLRADIFFGGVTNQLLTVEEADELIKFMQLGGIVYVSGFGGTSTANSGVAYNVLFESLGVSDKFTETAVFPGGVFQSLPLANDSVLKVGLFGEVDSMSYETYRRFDSNNILGVLKDSVFIDNDILFEKKVGRGYLIVSALPLYINPHYYPDPDNRNYFLNMFAMGCKPEDDTVVLDVPNLKQYDTRWNSDEYDSAIYNELGCGVGIGDCGCALTSGAMVMRFFGVNIGQNGIEVNPKSVNQYFIDKNWYWKGNFNWYRLDDYSNYFKEGNGVKLDQPIRENFDEEKIKSYIDEGIPVIVKVNSNTTPQHFVVIKGYDSHGLIMNDPLNPDPTGSYAYFADSGYTPFPAENNMIHYLLAHTDYNSMEIWSDGLVQVFKDGNLVGNYSTEGEGDYLGVSTHIFDLQLPEDGSYQVVVGPNQNGECNYRIETANTAGETLQYDLSGCGSHEFIYKNDEGGPKLFKKVRLDIVPANNMNFVNKGSEAVFPVAVLGSSDVNVFEINQYENLLSTASPFKLFSKDDIRDVNKDGYLDLILKFRINDLGEISNNEVCYEGALYNGLGLVGCDSLRMLH